MKTQRDLRHRARMKLVEELYAQRINPSTQSLPYKAYSYDENLYSSINESINKNNDEIDSLILSQANRDSDEIKSIEYVILKIAVAESRFSSITPYKVAIDEAIELAREYGDEASSTFVSGILGAIFRSNI